jgi:hypothetical protein
MLAASQESPAGIRVRLFLLYSKPSCRTSMPPSCANVSPIGGRAAVRLSEYDCRYYTVIPMEMPQRRSEAPESIRVF